MLIELKTKRRWMLSILETVADSKDAMVIARATVRLGSTRRIAMERSELTSRPKAATRPLAGKAQ